MSPGNDDKWRKRFRLFMLARLVGLATFLLGIAIAYSDLLKPGGWRLLGGIVIVLGLLDAIFAPRLLRKAWDEQDRREGGGPAR